MHSHEHSGMRVLGERECDQVNGSHILMGPVSPEPPITPIIPLSGGSPMLTFTGSPSATLTIPKPPGPTAPHVGPFPVH
jgi:hypothetical protein